MKKLFVFFVCLALPSWAFAEAAVNADLDKVQEQMKSPQFQEQFGNSSPEAQAVQNQIKDVMGSPENEKELYNLAAEFLGNLKGKSPSEMERIKNDIQKNPEAIFQYFTPEQKQKLEELTKRIPAGKEKSP